MHHPFCYLVSTRRDIKKKTKKKKLSDCLSVTNDKAIPKVISLWTSILISVNETKATLDAEVDTNTEVQKAMKRPTKEAKIQINEEMALTETEGN